MAESQKGYYHEEAPEDKARVERVVTITRFKGKYNVLVLDRL